MEVMMTILVFTTLLMSELSISSAVDTIDTTQSIKDNETLVSAGGTFELGFFSPDGSTNRYLGIWYNKLRVRTIVWVANRDVPLKDFSGVVRISNQGILVLQNHEGRIVWSSNSSRPVHNSPVAQLLDSGNLVVKEENQNNPENLVWQSFDYPGDTLLPGMKLGKNLMTGFNRYLSSWKSLDDPSHGNFTLTLHELGGFPELVVREGSSIILYRAGPWNGLRFSGTSGYRPNPIFKVEFVMNEKEVYYGFELLNSSIPSRVVLTEDGIWQRVNWNDRKQGWSVYATPQMDDCDNYAICGAFGSCSTSNSPNYCSCLKGFVPKFHKEWDTLHWSNGCVRKTPLNCSSDGFLKYSRIKLPDSRKSWFNYSMNLEECKNMCRKNCSCTAYANLDIRNGGTGCLLWFVDLVDIREFAENGQEIYIRMAASELDNKKARVRIALVCVLSITVSILVLALILYLWRKTFLKNQGLPTAPESSSNVKSEMEEMDFPSFDLTIIASATNDFSTANKLGEGGFGSIYKGILKDGQEIAVKRLSKSSTQGLQEFKNEVIHIAKLKHRNLVKLLGYCIEGDEKMLIYEYMPNRSLDFFIFDQSQSMFLDWHTRYHIINGIARGLLYLHQDSRERIIHRDMKASNILLDDEMNPKISDFGLARSFGEKETRAKTKKVVGTYGYIAPEYAIDGIYSTKSDVFSFGVLVLEIVSGRRNRGFCHPDHQLNLLGHAWMLFAEGKSLELIESPIKEASNPSEVLRSVHVGLLCGQRRPEDRPNMSDVLLMLGSKGPLAQPKQPGFFTERDLAKAEPGSSSGHSNQLSSNNYTITDVEAR